MSVKWYQLKSLFLSAHVKFIHKDLFPKILNDHISIFVSLLTTNRYMTEAVEERKEITNLIEERMIIQQSKPNNNSLTSSEKSKMFLTLDIYFDYE